MQTQLTEAEWYAQTWAGQRDALIAKATDLIEALTPAREHPVVAAGIDELEQMIERLRAASATPSVADLQDAMVGILTEMSRPQSERSRPAGDLH